VSFNEAWDKIGIPFNRLRQFCDGLATAFPNTTSVESDFSILKWEKDDNRSSMTDLSNAAHPCGTTINDTFLLQGCHNHKDPWMHNFNQGRTHKLAYFV
jgi:hypothetical protein